MTGPLGFFEPEMGGFSDSFAFTDVEKAQPHTHFGVNDEKNNAIFTAPEQGKISKEEHAKRIKEFESNKITQDKAYAEMMKKEQLNAVLRSEQEF